MGGVAGKEESGARSGGWERHGNGDGESVSGELEDAHRGSRNGIRKCDGGSRGELSQASPAYSKRQLGGCAEHVVLFRNNCYFIHSPERRGSMERMGASIISACRGQVSGAVFGTRSTSLMGCGGSNGTGSTELDAEAMSVARFQ